MKIISLIRSTLNVAGAPDEFTVGQPTGEGEGPVVSKIVAMREGKMDFFPEACYVIHFNDSTVRRIVPIANVEDLAYDTAKEDNAEEAAPALPEA